MNNLKVISLGVGLQSSTLYYMSSMRWEEMERADYAIFADPGSEGKRTYDYLKYLQAWQKANDGIPIIVTGKRTIYSDLLKGLNSTNQRFVSIPAFTIKDGKNGMVRRQCTEEYKIKEVNKAIRKLYKLKPRQRYPKTEVWTGISVDEIIRMKPSPFKWCEKKYPLVDIRFNRLDCENWLKSQGLEVAPRSACIFCPFQSDSRWKDMKKNRPREFQKAVILDKKIRNATKTGYRQPLFLHRARVPLEEVDFNENQQDMFANECEGGCGL